MKTVFNVILGLCALVLIYICYTSIMGPINFEKAKKHRDAAVIARLIDIRKAQLEYRTLHDQQYTASFDSLIDFVKNQKLPFIFKQGELNDKQLEDGLTEKKAISSPVSFVSNFFTNVVFIICNKNTLAVTSIFCIKLHSGMEGSTTSREKVENNSFFIGY